MIPTPEEVPRGHFPRRPAAPGQEASPAACPAFLQRPAPRARTQPDLALRASDQQCQRNSTGPESAIISPLISGDKDFPQSSQELAAGKTLSDPRF